MYRALLAFPLLTLVSGAVLLGVYGTRDTSTAPPTSQGAPADDAASDAATASDTLLAPAAPTGAQPAAPIVISATSTPEGAGPSAQADTRVRYIGNTGGDGVSLRSRCTDGARVPGAWAEGTEVLFEQAGSGECSGWSVVSLDSTTSWVHDGYLVSSRPPAGAAASAPLGRSLAGTAWALYSDLWIQMPGQYPFIETFLADGRIVLSEGDGTPLDDDTATWTQEGSRVTFSLYNSSSYFTGAISDDGARMEGTVLNAAGYGATWYAVRRR